MTSSDESGPTKISTNNFVPSILSVENNPNKNNNRQTIIENRHDVHDSGDHDDDGDDDDDEMKGSSTSRYSINVMDLLDGSSKHSHFSADTDAADSFVGDGDDDDGDVDGDDGGGHGHHHIKKYSNKKATASTITSRLAQSLSPKRSSNSSASTCSSKNNNNKNNSRHRHPDATEILQGSLNSLNLHNNGSGPSSVVGGSNASAAAAISPYTPPRSVEQNKRKLGKDFLKHLELNTSNHTISQLSLLVNDSAAGVPFDDVYTMGDVLGEGGFAFVYRCTHKKNGYEYAVKEILHTDNYQSANESIRGEINALKLLREGPYVVRLLDVYYEPDRTMMVQEIMRGGDLLDKLTEIEVYEPEDARKVSRTLLEAISYCHKKEICHRDIKPENILLVNENDLTHIKIADFGCAKKITGPKCLKTLCGSPQYVAPELLTHEDGYNEQCDMWSCGVVIYVLLGGYAPFDAPECELAELITAGVYEFHEEYWDEVPKAAKNLVEHLLQVDPEDRYDPNEALNCRWLRRKDKDLASSSHESNSSFGAWLERRNHSGRSLMKDNSYKTT